MVHAALHILIPLALALSIYRKKWKGPFLWMLLTLLVDLDHLWADPVYDPGRCSINFHPLHQVFLFPLYGLLLFFPKARPVGIGLLSHMALDWSDCLL